MGKYSVSQVEAAINAEFLDYPEEFYSEVGSNGYVLSDLKERAYCVSREGGYEGGGEYMDVVFQIGDQLFRKQGCHNSWDANSWDGNLEEVESYEEIVTKYRAI